MPDKSVTAGDSQTPTDERGVPLENVQKEFSRKLEKMQEEFGSQMQQINQKLEALFATEEEPEDAHNGKTYDPREELKRISNDPRSYVDEIVKPVREQAEKLAKENEELRRSTMKSRWERMEDEIAKLEGKKSWDELPSEVTTGVISIIKERGWNNNPSSALDAYEIFQARKLRQNREDPQRIERIQLSQSEGAGRASGKTPVKTITRDLLSQLSSSHPSDPNYKKNMELLTQVQSGLVKIEN